MKSALTPPRLHKVVWPAAYYSCGTPVVAGWVTARALRVPVLPYPALLEGRAVSYTAADITELDDVQHTRLRPAVNLGLDVLNTALRELVDNAIEEVADPNHGGSTVTITLHADGS